MPWQRVEAQEISRSSIGSLDMMSAESTTTPLRSRRIGSLTRTILLSASVLGWWPSPSHGSQQIHFHRETIPSFSPGRPSLRIPLSVTPECSSRSQDPGIQLLSLNGRIQRESFLSTILRSPEGSRLTRSSKPGSQYRQHRGKIQVKSALSITRHSRGAFPSIRSSGAGILRSRRSLPGQSSVFLSTTLHSQGGLGSSLEIRSSSFHRDRIFSSRLRRITLHSVNAHGSRPSSQAGSHQTRFSREARSRSSQSTIQHSLDVNPSRRSSEPGMPRNHRRGCCRAKFSRSTTLHSVPGPISIQSFALGNRIHSLNRRSQERLVSRFSPTPNMAHHSSIPLPTGPLPLASTSRFG